MTEECRFWLDWAVNALIAVGTIGAVVVALRLHVRLFPPQLKLGEVSPDGQPEIVLLHTVENNVVVKSRPEDARYYRVLLSNARPWIHATDVGVYLVAIETEDASGQYIQSWSGSLPIVATHYGVYPTRTLGAAPQEFDLCSVVRGKWVELHPLVVPNTNLHRFRLAE